MMFRQVLIFIMGQPRRLIHRSSLRRRPGWPTKRWWSWLTRAEIEANLATREEIELP